MRISDWSSDVCSSDLHAHGPDKDCNMNFTMSPAETMWRDRVRNFMNDVVRPHDETYAAQQASGERWKTLPIIEELKERAKADGIWNLFMPPQHGRAYARTPVTTAHSVCRLFLEKTNCHK